MAIIRVDHAELMARASDIGNSAAQIESELQSLGSKIGALEGDWEGEAQVQFAQLFATWQKGAAEVHQALQGIQRLLNQAGMSFGDTDSSAARSFSIR